MFNILFLIKVTNTCPAIILMQRRNNNVIGRIKKLINSIIIITGINIKGVFKGNKWVKKLFFVFIKFINNKGNHNIKIKGKLKVKWLVKLKLKKFKLIKLTRKIIIKNILNKFFNEIKLFKNCIKNILILLKDLSLTKFFICVNKYKHIIKEKDII
jgi:hypothetical protein